MSDDRQIPRGKAGISWPAQELTSDPIAKFFQYPSKLSWHWNWTKHWKGPLVPATPDDLDIDAEFVPMIWSPKSLDDGCNLQEGWDLLLGFNEPDLDNEAVASHRSPQEAADGWFGLAQLRTDPDKQHLVSPAVASNVEWLKEFLSLIPEDIYPTYLAVHLYTTTFDDFVRKVEMYRNEFGLPIILTEFCMQSWDEDVPGPQDQQQVHDYMGQTTKWLDETDYVIKYCWFGAVRDTANLHGVHRFNRLMDENGEITPLGFQYMYGGHE
ncbi:hypothetical protein I307_00182 [Cryptococcus deuterogattii 99/473]|uniref:Asl1-like glycosyl hydrolase catalytic domain-containing protein n=2 Tax=Cryptococcus deuterogattii TaxID=1859096 RepID=A0A0D0V8E3_9TREE|nr:hypothetical protein CNBG_3128 [Cryptococcus deuterogattii R265]KIR30105.1 hypothetical protein I309_00973 [Cryptococcus deuterogattii LA55]KIR43776.1 hypothetical protein I313_00621 [Cryptococcus deuterogattii Ram5]KIR75108.1 hypothetical protein I310_01385 [Cryptococcus deuterogattii CA1014]KIR92777.1 hypothetical protein I304_03357 [Cryptococcus deuterogattii CBS 10090]KIR98099.1 hypothetical protein L804_04560 [Cryptococcus deuterogattii 2001/935-1]KIY60382.1 hypothetical protein I307_